MGKALVIKGVDFSENALDTITFGEDVPCTGITVDGSMSIIGIGQERTLSYTLTPSNTTDTPSIVSNDSNVVSVSGDVLTTTGIGAATITITCGNQTATCIVTVNPAWLWGKAEMAPLGNSIAALKDYTYSKDDSKMIAGGALTGSKYASVFIMNLPTDNIFPYPVPDSASSVTITADENYAIRVEWYDDTQESADASSAGGATKHSNVAKLVSAESYNDARDYYVAPVYLTRTISVPQGANSFVISLRATTSEIREDFDSSHVTVTFN